MTFNEITIQAYYQAIKLMFTNKPVTEGMKELDRLVRSLAPHPIWDKLQKIDFESELPTIREFTANETARHPEGVAVLLFRLSDLGDQMQLVFLCQEREPTGDSDWEAYDDSRYADVASIVLEQMAGLAETELTDSQGSYTNQDAGWILETCYPLAYSGLAVGRILHSLPAQALLGSDESRKVAVFFGEGDDFIFGEITPQGFRYNPIPDFIPK
jgi:hypothetical protein